LADEDARTVFHVGGFCLDVRRGSLCDPSGASLALRPKTFDLLTYLFRNPRRIVSRDELMEAVWPGVFVTDDSLTQCIAEIRRAFGTNGTRLLRTVPKRGYVFTADASGLLAELPKGTKASLEARQAPPDLAGAWRSLPQEPVIERRLAAILAADIAGYSRLVGLDEAGTFRRVKALRAKVFEPLVAKHRGRIVSYAGDGALAEFPSVIRAVECALAIQKVTAEREPGVPPERRFVLRIGIHSGDVIVDADNDLCGDAVNIAARLEKLAEPGGICLSDRA
jgi:DNA-binding winged helix-turn-helix (wHTH) protein